MEHRTGRLAKIITGCMTALLVSGSGSATAFAANAGGVAINAVNFPDPNFRAVISGYEYDRDGNDFLDANELAATLNIYCEGMNIYSLQGIEYFTNLQGLWCKDNRIAAMDLSHNPDLRGVWCSGNDFTCLDFRYNPELVWVYCYDCRLISLNVTNNPKLAFIECNTNPLPVLDVTHNPELEHLTCGSCELTSLDLSHNPKLAHLDAFRNHLTSLDITHNPLMKRLDIWDNPGLGSIDLSMNPGLQYYNCAHNDAYTVDVSHNPELQKLICSYNHLQTLDLSHNPELVYLDCAVNRLTALDLSRNPRLFFLQAFTNNFTTLNIGNNSRLLTTYYSGIMQNEYAVCQGHSWSVDYGYGLLYFLCFDDTVALNTFSAEAFPDVTDCYINENDGLTAADDLLTREMAVQTLYDLAGRPDVTGLSSSFTDVVPGAWYEDALIWAANNHICMGCPYINSPTFGVGQWITRQDLAFMLLRYAELMNYYSAFDYGRTDDYQDYYDIDYYAWDAVTWAVQWGIMSPKGEVGAPKEERLLLPHGRVSRAEFTQILTNFLAP